MHFTYKVSLGSFDTITSNDVRSKANYVSRDEVYYSEGKEASAFIWSDWGEILNNSISNYVSTLKTIGGVTTQIAFGFKKNVSFTLTVDAEEAYLTLGTPIIGRAQSGGAGWVSSVDWAGVANAFLNVLGGVGEIILGGAVEYFSASIATSVCVPLIVDGGYRTATNFSRFVGYLTLNDRFANAMPGNIGATIGKGIDMLSGVPIDGYGYGQGIGGATNDFVSFIVTGGTAVSISNMISNPSLMNGVWYMSAYGGYTNSLFYDLYPLKK